MIQDIAPHRYRNEYNPKPPEKDSIMLCYDGHQVLLEKKGEEIRFPTFAELEKENDGIYENYTYLFEIDGKCFYLGEHIRYAQPVSYTHLMIEDVTTSGKSMEETVPKVKGAADVEIVGLMVSLDQMCIRDRCSRTSDF